MLHSLGKFWAICIISLKSWPCNWPFSCLNISFNPSHRQFLLSCFSWRQHCCLCSLSEEVSKRSDCWICCLRYLWQSLRYCCSWSCCRQSRSPCLLFSVSSSTSVVTMVSTSAVAWAMNKRAARRAARVESLAIVVGDLW